VKAGLRPAHVFVTAIGRGAVEQGDEGDGFALLAKLAGHFVGDISAEAITAEVIRTERLDTPDLAHIEGGHVLERGELLRAIESPRFDAVHGLTRTEMGGEIGITPKDITARAMDEKQGRIGTLRLDGDDGRTAGARFLREHIGQLLDRRMLK